MNSSLEKNIFLGNPKILSISTFLFLQIIKIVFSLFLRFGFFKLYAGLFKFLLFYWFKFKILFFFTVLRFGFFNFYMDSVQFFLFYCFELERLFFFTVSEIWVMEIQGSIDKGWYQSVRICFWETKWCFCQCCWLVRCCLFTSCCKVCSVLFNFIP